MVRDRLRLVLPDEEMAQAVENDTALVAAAGMAPAGKTRVIMSRLAICLDELDAPKRDSILYAYVDGCSHGEIAARLGAPLGSVKALGCVHRPRRYSIRHALNATHQGIVDLPAHEEPARRAIAFGTHQ